MKKHTTPRRAAHGAGTPLADLLPKLRMCALASAKLATETTIDTADMWALAAAIDEALQEAWELDERLALVLEMTGEGGHE